MSSAADQLRLDWNPPARPAPPAVDPSAAAPVRRRAIAINRRLAVRLIAGPIATDELEGGGPEILSRPPFGRRYSARIHDLRRWLQAAGYVGDPLPHRPINDTGAAFEWRLTPAARELARHLLGDLG